MNANLSGYSATEEARELVNRLLYLESQGGSSMEARMKRLARRYGLPWRTFWRIKYRAPNDVFVGVLRKLREAYVAETERRIERMAHELYIAKINGVRVDDLENQMEALRVELETCLAKRGEV